MKKRLLCLLACLLAAALPCASCAKYAPEQNLPDDAVILAAARDLLPRSVEINRLFFETGFPAEEGGRKDGAYTEVSAAFLAEHGFYDCASVRRTIAAVYSAAATDDFYEMAVNFTTEGGVRPVYLRDLTDESGAFVCLLVSDAGLHATFDAAVYDLTTLRVESKTADSARVSVTAAVTDADGRTQTRTRTLGLRFEAGEWRLDTLSVIKYFEEPAG